MRAGEEFHFIEVMTCPGVVLAAADNPALRLTKYGENEWRDLQRR